jgi:hypothetical protein
MDRLLGASKLAREGFDLQQMTAAPCRLAKPQYHLFLALGMVAAVRRFGMLVVALLVGAVSTAAASASEVTLNAPVLSVYDDGFRTADDRGHALRGDAWTLCGDSTRNHIGRGDRLVVTGDRDWRWVAAQSITREDGTPACPEDAAPRY